MNWQLTVRNFFIITLKTAVGALIVNVGAWWILPANFNLHDKAAMWNIAKLAVWIVGASEARVWVPKLLAWSQTPEQALEKARVATKKAAAVEVKAQEAVRDAQAVAPQAQDKKQP